MNLKSKISKFVSYYWLFGILLVLLGFDIAYHFCCCKIASEGIILVLIGILATFVVVGNYAQVKDIENKMEERIKSLESEIHDVKKIKEDIKQTLKNGNQSIIFELVKLIRQYESANKEEKEKLINELYSFSENDSEIVRDKVFEIIGRIINTKIRSKITYAFTEQIHTLITTFLLPGLNDKSFLEFSEISLNYAYDLTYNTFIKTKKVAPAEFSIAIVSYINKLSQKRNIPKLKKAVFEFFERMEIQLKRTDVGDQEDALKLLKVFKDDLKNFDDTFPLYEDKALRDRIAKEIDKEGKK